MCFSLQKNTEWRGKDKGKSSQINMIEIIGINLG